jgi:hypothetical protein
MPVERFPVTDWQAELLRLTCFTRLGDVVAPTVDWWARVAGAEPESQSSKPRRGAFEHSGPFAGGALVLRTDVGRIDWLLRVAASDEPSSTVPTIGPFAEKLQIFQQVAATWFERDDLPQLTRVAFGAVLIHSERSREQAYNQLAAYLNRISIDPATQDFSYQLNVPCASSVLSGQINRLMKWSAVSWQAVFVTDAGLAQEAPSFSCRLELDINTPAGGVPTLRERVKDVFDELVGLGRAIAESGEPK